MILLRAFAVLLALTLAASAQVVVDTSNPTPSTYTVAQVGIGTQPNYAQLQPAPSGGAVLFDAAFSANCMACGATTISYIHTPVGTPTAVEITVSNDGGAATVSGVTYGGNAATLVQTVTAPTSTRSIAIYCLVNPPSGAQSVVATFSGLGFYGIASSLTVTGSNTTTCVDASNTATGNSAAASVSVTSATGELVVDAVVSDTNGTQTPGGGQTSQFTTFDSKNGGSYKTAGAGSTSMTWTLPSGNWGQAAMSFKK